MRSCILWRTAWASVSAEEPEGEDEGAMWTRTSDLVEAPRPKCLSDSVICL